MKNPFVHTQFIVSIILLSFITHLQAQEPTTIKIGNQEWTSKNLDVVTFRNGDSIPEAKTYEAWVKASLERKAAWCNQANLPEYGQKYGKLYNWYAVNDARGLAPKEYHVSTKAEWDSLISYLGGDGIAGKKLKSTEGWMTKYVNDEEGSLHDGKSINEIGFSGLPGGKRYSNGNFCDVGGYAGFWSATETDPYYAWPINVYYYDDFINSNDGAKGAGLSVRCLRD